MLKLWNTATRRLEEFAPLRPPQVGMYACGPTVYQRAQIGNFRAYTMEDILRRALEVNGYEVRHIMNITDVGHPAGDVDEGEDKMEKASRNTGRRLIDIAEEYTQLFMVDMERMNILRPSVMPRATQTIPEQIAIVQELEKKGYTYQTSDGIYFDTSKFKDYGALSGQPLEEKEEGARVAINPEKRHSTDFSLWKFSDPTHPRQMEWESPWGVGFPGWHIECSAMSRMELGQPFDIHAGGVDHIPVHHENEIAQSVAAFGVPLARYWFHVDFLLIDGKKMSKSLGNDYNLDDIVEHGFTPLDYRYFLLGAHYRQKQNFTWEALQGAQNAFRKLQNIVRTWDEPATACVDLEAEFMAAIDDDLNTPRGLAVLWKTVDSDEPSSSKAATLLMMDRILGLGLGDVVAKSVAVPEEIRALMNAREKARKDKDWTESDRLRDEIQSKGWSVEDTAAGQRVYSL